MFKNFVTGKKLAVFALSLLLLAGMSACGGAPITSLPDVGDLTKAPESTSTQTSESPPSSDVRGEDIDDVPRYPGSVRTSYVFVEGKGGEIEYLAEATAEEVISFYEQALPSRGWSSVGQLAKNEDLATFGEKEDKAVFVTVSSSDDYSGYAEIKVTLDLKK